MPAVLIVLLTAAAVVVVLMGATALVARRVGRLAVVDVVWGSGFVLVAAVTIGVGLAAADDVDAGRAALVLGLVAIWGGRLAWHIRSRAHGLLSPGEKPPEDPRYAELMQGKPFSYAVTRVFVTQGVAMLVVASPVVVAMALPVADGWGWWVAGLGVAVWAVGLAFEAIGDRQLADYKAIPKGERPQVMDRGLWAWTRHPNYFGDATVWWGLWLVGGLASGWVAGLATLVAPVAMTYFLAFATGARLLERQMMQRPGYPAYAGRTSMFVPLPPKRS